MKGFRGRALFNLLRLKYKNKELPSSLESWQVDDYRGISTDELFERLKQLNITLDFEGFELYAKGTETPEQLLFYVLPKNVDEKKKLHIYLILFELWRRFIKDRPSLSILCDELDHLIESFYRFELDEEKASEMFIILENLLDQSVDEGNSPPSVFVVLSSYVAHDLQTFIYEYIQKMIEEGKHTYASELIEGFFPYMPNQTAFDLLRTRIVAESDPIEANLMSERLSEKIIKENQKPLAFDLLGFLAKHGKPDLFYRIYQQVVPMIETEKEFKKMLEIAADYYRGFDKDFEENEILNLIDARKNIDPNKRVEIKEMISKIFNQVSESS